MSKPKFVGLLIIWAGSHFLRGWALMIAVHVAHHGWSTAIPTIGYWWAVLIALLFGAATSRLPDSFWTDEPRSRIREWR